MSLFFLLLETIFALHGDKDYKAQKPKKTTKVPQAQTTKDPKTTGLTRNTSRKPSGATSSTSRTSRRSLNQSEGNCKIETGSPTPYPYASISTQNGNRIGS
ncbi:hypothetical protein P3X46_026613 [Hevea brasiliensis]|uniref:Uncharacterized protein n=1 Tax=Hevea brasiliensis TaxID=3981 RepID=A0ABQ9KX91_HEVBR|nr:hypothetical protein P3X46_026613 [Hevea brasiliensis]